MLTSCSVGDNTFVGEGSVVEAGAEIGANCVIAAGTVVTRNLVIPAGQFWAGNPAKYIRDATEQELLDHKISLDRVGVLGQEHSAEFLPYGTLYQQAEKAGHAK